MIALGVVLVLSAAPLEPLDQRIEEACPVDATLDGDDLNVDAAGLGSIACVAGAVERAIVRMDCRTEADAVRCSFSLASSAIASATPAPPPVAELTALAWSPIEVESLAWKPGGRMLVRGRAASQTDVDALAATSATTLDLLGVTVAPAASSSPSPEAWGGAGDWRLSAADARWFDLRRLVGVDGDAFVSGSAGLESRASATVAAPSRVTLLASLKSHAPPAAFVAIAKGVGLEKGKGRKVTLAAGDDDAVAQVAMLDANTRLQVVAPPRMPRVAVQADGVSWDDVLAAMASAMGFEVEPSAGDVVWLLPADTKPPDLGLRAGPPKGVRLRISATAAEGEALVDSLTGAKPTLPCGGEVLQADLRLPVGAILPVLAVMGGVSPGAPCDAPVETWDHHVDTLRAKDAVLLATLTAGPTPRALVRLPLEPLLVVMRANPREALDVTADALSLPDESIAMRIAAPDARPARSSDRIPLCDFRLAATLVGPDGRAALLETRRGDVTILRTKAAPFPYETSVRDGETTLVDPADATHKVIRRVWSRAPSP